MLPLIEAAVLKNITNIVLIAPEFDRDLLNRLNTTKLKNPTTNFVPIKFPTYDKDDILIDIATLSNGKFFDKNAHPSLDLMVKEMTIDNLGKVDRAIINESSSALVGGKGDTSKRVEELKKKFSKTMSVFDKNRLEQRIAFLSGGVAIIKVGAESDTERLYYRRKIEDAVNAAQMALRDGVIPGGGVALKEISEKLPVSIITKALKRPYEQIQENAGEEFVVPAEVVDPVAITISSLKSACSVAGMIATTEITVANKDVDNSKNHDSSEG